MFFLLLFDVYCVCCCFVGCVDGMLFVVFVVLFVWVGVFVYLKFEML